jgi:hypothetical protein
MVGAAAVGVILSACSHGSGPTVATMRTTGVVTVGSHAISGGPVPVRRGDLITVQKGTASISLPGSSHIDLRTGSVLSLADVPTLVAGDLLATSGASPVRIDTTIGEVTVSGVARLHRDLALSVGTFKGVATIAAGRTVALPALTQDTIPTVSVTPVPTPLRLNSADEWDQRLMGTAIEITNQLDSASRYVNANVSPASASSAFYVRDLRQLAGVHLDEQLLRSVGINGSSPAPGDVLDAAAIALSGTGDFSMRWKSAFALRAAGAQWGVIALDEAANPAGVVQLVQGAVNGTVSGVALVAASPASAPHAPAAPATPSTAQTATPPKVVAAPAATHHTTRTTPKSTGTSKPGSPSAPASPTVTVTPPNTVLLGPVLNPIVDPLGHLLSSLLGGK